MWAAYKKLLEAKDLPKNFTVVSMFKVNINSSSGQNSSHIIAALKEKGSHWPQFFSSKEREARRRCMEKELSGLGGWVIEKNNTTILLPRFFLLLLSPEHGGLMQTDRGTKTRQVGGSQYIILLNHHSLGEGVNISFYFNITAWGRPS